MENGVATGLAAGCSISLSDLAHSGERLDSVAIDSLVFAGRSSRSSRSMRIVLQKVQFASRNTSPLPFGWSIRPHELIILVRFLSSLHGIFSRLGVRTAFSISHCKTGVCMTSGAHSDRLNVNVFVRRIRRLWTRSTERKCLLVEACRFSRAGALISLDPSQYRYLWPGTGAPRNLIQHPDQRLT